MFRRNQTRVSKDSPDEPFRSQKTLAASCRLPGGERPAQPGRPGRPQGFPCGGSERVTEDRQPSSRVFIYSMYNSAVLLEKFWRSPNTFWEIPSFEDAREAACPAGAGMRLPQGRAASSALDLCAAAHTYRTVCHSGVSQHLSLYLTTPRQLVTPLQDTAVILLPPVPSAPGAGEEGRQRGEQPARLSPGGEHQSWGAGPQGTTGLPRGSPGHHGASPGVPRAPRGFPRGPHSLQSTAGTEPGSNVPEEFLTRGPNLVRDNLIFNVSLNYVN